jgi:S1-C subfamily serine protease
MACIGSQYAILRGALLEYHRAPPRELGPLTERVEAALAFARPLSEAELMAANEIPQCAVVWGGKGFASGVYIGGGSVVTAQHVCAAFPPANVSLDIADAAGRRGKAIAVGCQIPARDPLAYDVMVLKIDPGAVSGLPCIPLATPAEFAALSAAGADVMVVGFGCGWPPGHPEQAAMGLKRKIIVPVVPGQGAGIIGFDPNLQFVVGDTGASAPYHAVCMSDSGGPVFATLDGNVKLIGVVHASGSPLGATPDGCGISPYSVATRVDARRDWILRASC